MSRPTTSASSRASSGWRSGVGRRRRRARRAHRDADRAAPRHRPGLALGLILFPAATILVPLAGPACPEPAILALLFLSEFGPGFGVMILDINVGAMISPRTPDRIRGRANGAFRFINMGIRPIGAAIGGVLGGVLGVPRDALRRDRRPSCSACCGCIGSPILGLRGLPEAGE